MAAQGLSVFPISPSSSATGQSCRSPFEQCLSFNLSKSFVGTKLLIQPSGFSLIASRRRSSTVATISFSLPTTTTEGVASDKKPKWSARSIKSFAMAELEARKLKYPNTGTEALLMGILVEGTSLAAKFLRENGVTLFKVREETVKLLGKSDLYFFSPEHPP
ncbi:UNVERIFIED_CONTAM: ATP-dependent Clp protease ATP-binding subunit CLPT1, chloroplastic [Sesamum angustifolium]|uniref:ATP-dependent Clp protease ATP-binding subunit CLPT1, chloroplastic n=1 Tax=Sesamum angustifolium TaxID=2727405 RepID=A0AAW2LG67_9LAMI